MSSDAGQPVAVEMRARPPPRQSRTPAAPRAPAAEGSARSSPNLPASDPPASRLPPSGPSNRTSFASSKQRAPDLADSYTETHVVGRGKLRPGWSRYVGQVDALIRKNTLLMRRHWVSTIVQVLSPVVFIVLVAIVEAAVSTSTAATVHPSPFLSMVDGGDGDIPSCNVFDTSQGRYGLGNIIPQAWCNSIVYAPSGNAEVNTIMVELARRRGFSIRTAGSPSVAATEDVVGFTTEADLRTHLGEFEGRSGFAVVFNETTPGSSTLPEDVVYEVWFNATINEWWVTRAGLDKPLADLRYRSDVIRVQRAVDQAILATRFAGAKGSSAEAAGFDVDLRQFPMVKNEDDELSVVSSFLPLFIYCAVMTNFIIAVNQIVAEKESGMMAGMRAMGLMESAYWLSKIVEYTILTLLSTCLVVVAGIITDLHVFVKTDFHVMYLTFFLYSASMIGMAFALASVISTTKVGNILSFLLFIIGMIFNVFNISGFGYLLFDPSIFSDTAIKAMMFYPPLDFAKAYADIDYVTRPSLVWDFDQLKHVVQEGGDYTWSSLNGDTYSRANQTSATGGGTYHVPPTMETLEWMSIAYLVFVFLAWYLGQIITGGHGRPQYPWFPLDPTFWGLNLCGRVPSDVSKAGVDIRNLTKQFGMCKKFTAVNGLSLKMERGKVFALLGHNGAGKTTAIKMITGHIKPTAGEAYVNGYGVNSDISKVQQLMGVCPQHDLLWGDLTPVEHLRIFAKFKGVPSHSIDAMWERFLRDVRLYDVRHKATKTFSGGMKRRLSVAISLVGDPAVCILDEPTTGMDPMNRRYVWDMIIKLKRGRVVLLTTHSMEEADALGDHICIMSAGKEVAAGTSLHLKNTFGGGYQVKLVTPQHNVAQLKAVVQQRLPAAKLVDDSAGSLSYAVPLRAVAQVPPFFEWVEDQQQRGDDSLFTDWGLSHTTLEEVFIRLARAERSNHGHGSSRRLEAAASESTRSLPVAAGAGAAARGLADAANSGDPAWLRRLSDNAKGSRITTYRQFRGLVRKSCSWHLHQTKSLVCQLVCPLLLLGLILMLQLLVIDPLQEDLANKNESDRVDMLAACNRCKERRMTDCQTHQNDWGWCGTSTDPYCLPSYCGSASFIAETNDRCWECARYDELYSGEFVEEDARWTTPAFEEPNTGNYQVQIGETNVQIQLDTSDFVPAFAYVPPPGVDVGKFEGGVILANSTENLYGWRDNKRYIENQEFFRELEALASRNRSGLLGDFPLPRFGRAGDQNDRNNGPYANKQPWEQRLDRFNFDVQQAEAKAADPNHNTQSWSPPGNRWANNYLMSPDLQRFTTADDVDNFVWRNQERIRDNEFPTYAVDDPTPYKLITELFPQASIELKTVDTVAGRLKLTLQSFFQWISQDSGGGFRYAILQKRGKPSWCSNGGGDSEECQRDQEAVRPPWWTNVYDRLTLANRVMTGVSTMWLRHNVNKNMSIEAGFRPFPYKNDASKEWDPEIILNNILNLLVPLSTSFLVPVFTFKLVFEKQNKLRAMMLSSGLHQRVYWMAAMLFDLTFQLGLVVAFYFVGLAMQIRFFQRSSTVLFLGLFSVWAVCSVMYAYLLSTLFNRTKPATIVSYLILILSVVSSMVINPLSWGVSDEAPVGYFLFAPMAYYRGVYLLTQRSYVIEDVSSSDELVKIIMWVGLDAVFYFILTLYLDNVLPKTYGVSKSPIFCITDLCGRWRRRMNKFTPTIPSDTSVVDDDVLAEYQRVAAKSYPEAAPVQVMNLVKEFSGGKVAVNNVSLVIEDKMCFGLLGPNGAGKTTLISTLTGLHSVSRGTATIGGYDIRSQMSSIYQVIGICPQFDIHFPSLSVREHLLLYARLKGVNPTNEAALIEAMIQGVGLSGKGDAASKELSGGMRRRLSFGMALVGNPRVLFLDEPSTGLDPETRRQLWRLVNMCTTGRCVILTTHSMDEADALASRIGIMANGSLRCLGTNLHLKGKFGGGFKIHVTFSHGDKKRVHDFVVGIVPRAKLLHDFAGSLSYQVRKSDLVVSTTFQHMEERPEGLFDDWSIQQTSLEEVFLRIAHAAETENGGTH